MHHPHLFVLSLHLVLGHYMSHYSSLWCMCTYLTTSLTHFRISTKLSALSSNTLSCMYYHVKQLLQLIFHWRPSALLVLLYSHTHYLSVDPGYSNLVVKVCFLLEYVEIQHNLHRRTGIHRTAANSFHRQHGAFRWTIRGTDHCC